MEPTPTEMLLIALARISPRLFGWVWDAYVAETLLPGDEVFAAQVVRHAQVLATFWRPNFHGPGGVSLTPRLETEEDISVLHELADRGWITVDAWQRLLTAAEKK